MFSICISSISRDLFVPRVATPRFIVRSERFSAAADRGIAPWLPWTPSRRSCPFDAARSASLPGGETVVTLPEAETELEEQYGWGCSMALAETDTGVSVFVGGSESGKVRHVYAKWMIFTETVQKLLHVQISVIRFKILQYTLKKLCKADLW